MTPNEQATIELIDAVDKGDAKKLCSIVSYRILY